MAGNGLLGDEESGDIVAFVVERGDEGVGVEPLPTMGLRSMGFGSLSLESVPLPADRLVVGADALSVMKTYLRSRRLMTGCSVVGHICARSLMPAYCR